MRACQCPAHAHWPPVPSPQLHHWRRRLAGETNGEEEASRKASPPRWHSHRADRPPRSIGEGEKKRRGASLHVPRFFFPHAGRRGPARVVIDDGDGATTGGAEHMHGARRSGSAASSPLSAGVDGSLDAVPLAQLGRLLLPETQTPRQRQPAACRSVWTFDRL